MLRHHLLPRAWAGPIGDAVALGPHLDAVRGHPMARAALELAVLDAQLRAAGRSLAGWLGATHATVPAGAALGLHDDVDDLLEEADDALAAGAVRLRVKVAPGRAAAHLAALRAHVGDGVLLQADANGSFAEGDRELDALDEVGLACLEQPLAVDDLLAHARLAERLATPICLDEPLTSLAAIEAAVALGACEVVCLKPARVGGWIAARAVHDRCAATRRADVGRRDARDGRGPSRQPGGGRPPDGRPAPRPGPARPLLPRPRRPAPPRRWRGGGPRRARHGGGARLGALATAEVVRGLAP